MNPYFKTTKGYNAEVVVAKAVAYTTDATFKLFVENAVEGEIGVFNADTHALMPATGPAAVGLEVYIAQKRDGQIHQTESFPIQAGFGTYTAYAAGAANVWTVTATGTAVAKGKIFEVALIELTTGAQPYKPFNFYVELKTGETLAQALTRLAALISDVNHPQWYAYGQIATASAAAGVLTITAVDPNRFFKVVIRQDLSEATLVQTVAPSLGSGTPGGIASIEGEGVIFSGETTNYPLHGNPDEYGQATRFTDADEHYDVTILAPIRKVDSPMPFHQHTHKSYIFLALPTVGAATPKTAIKVIFGFEAYVAPI